MQWDHHSTRATLPHLLVEIETDFPLCFYGPFYLVWQADPITFISPLSSISHSLLAHFTCGKIGGKNERQDINLINKFSHTFLYLANKKSCLICCNHHHKLFSKIQYFYIKFSLQALGYRLWVYLFLPPPFLSMSVLVCSCKIVNIK